MAIENVPTLSETMGEVPDRADRSTFSARATALYSWIKNVFTDYLEDVADNVHNNATEAASSATAAAASSVTATTKATEAAASALAAAAYGTVVDTDTASASSYIELTGMVAGYDYEITADGVYLSAADESLQFRLISGGSPITTNVYTYAVEQITGAASSNGGSGGSPVAQFLMGKMGSASDERGTLRIFVPNPAGAVTQQTARWETCAGGGSPVHLHRGGGVMDSSGAVTGVRIFASGGATITAGNFILRRIARS